MKPLAPIVDQVREIAREELAAPRAMKLQLWDDGDYDIWAYHSMGEDEREQIVYDNGTGEVLWQYWRGLSWESTFVSEEWGTRHDPVFEESEKRRITVIEPP